MAAVQPDVQKITARGTGVQQTDLVAGSPLVVPAGRGLIAFVRNRSNAAVPGDLILTVTNADDSDGVPGPGMSVVVPASQNRYLKLAPRLGDTSGLITYILSGDVTRADAAVIDAGQ